MIAERFQGSAEADEVIKLSVDAMLECIGPDLWEEVCRSAQQRCRAPAMARKAAAVDVG